jgi:glycerol uptake facilitator-like aquaporin
MDGAGKTVKELAIIGGLEALGTAILLVAINFSGGNPTFIVMGILTGAVLSGRLTGAHFNPAVTVAVLIADKSSKFKSNLPLAGVMVVS